MKPLCHPNSTVALKILLLIGFAAFFFTVIFTGSVRLYVHPRIIPFMLFSAVAMLVIALLLCRNLFSATPSGPRLWSLLFFAVPLLMAFFIPAKAFDSGTGTTGSVQLSGQSIVESTSSAQAAASDLEVSSKANISEAAAQSLPEVEIQPETIPLQDGMLVLTSENFYAGLCAVYDHLDDYMGTPISMVGYVFKDNDNFAPNQFVPARLLMVCCAADMQPTGLLCLYDDAPSLEANSWVTVTGTISQTTFEGETIPCILPQRIEATQEPAEPYVYPY